MKIIVAPSKTQETDLNNDNIRIFNQKKTIHLFNTLKSLTKLELGKTLKLKNNLLEETFELYQSYKSSNKGLVAIRCYQGVVFEQIELDSFNLKQREYLNKHLIILSGMYGVVKPNDVIWPYRLDMTIKPRKINLYDYWQESVNDYFKNEDVIINLASNEFSKMLRGYEDKMINIHFLERQKKGILKVISYNAKKARGVMVNYLISHQTKEIKDLTKVVIDGYKYDKLLSDDNNLYFIK
jgi:uncharacterized protein